MTQGDRTEIRDMIHGILSGWHAETVAREDVITISLNGINKRLDKINGTITEHGKIISENLPVTEAHCSKSSTIDELEKAFIGEEAIKKQMQIADNLRRANTKEWWYRVLTMIGILAAITFGILNYNKNNKVESKVDNMGEPVITNPRGEVIDLPAGTRLRMYPRHFLGDSASNDSIKKAIIKSVSK